MNESPDTDDDQSIRRLLAESGTRESPALLEGLRMLRSFRGLPAPAPTGELAAMLAETPAPPQRRPQRHRGLILSFALAGAMAAGTTGVAANNDLRLATESFCADVIEHVLPAGSGENPLPAEPVPAEPLPAGVPAEEPLPEEPLSADPLSEEPLPAGAPDPAGEAPAVVDDGAAEPEAEFASGPGDPGAYPVASPEGGVPGEYEVPAEVEAPSPDEAPLPVPDAEPEPAAPDNSAPEAGQDGGRSITAWPHQGNAGSDAGISGNPSGPGNSRDGRDGRDSRDGTPGTTP